MYCCSPLLGATTCPLNRDYPHDNLCEFLRLAKDFCKKPYHIIVIFCCETASGIHLIEDVLSALVGSFR